METIEIISGDSATWVAKLLDEDGVVVDLGDFDTVTLTVGLSTAYTDASPTIETSGELDGCATFSVPTNAITSTVTKVVVCKVVVVKNNDETPPVAIERHTIRFQCRVIAA